MDIKPLRRKLLFFEFTLGISGALLETKAKKVRVGLGWTMEVSGVC